MLFTLFTAVDCPANCCILHSCNKCTTITSYLEPQLFVVYSHVEDQQEPKHQTQDLLFSIYSFGFQNVLSSTWVPVNILPLCSGILVARCVHLKMHIDWSIPERAAVLGFQECESVPK
jgi:hypothetical protein